MKAGLHRFLGVCSLMFGVAMCGNVASDEPAVPKEPSSYAAGMRAEYFNYGLDVLRRAIDLLPKRIEPLQIEVDRMLQDVATTKVPPPAENLPKAKTVEYRPPLAHFTNKRHQIGIICEDRRITLVDFPALLKIQESEEFQRRGSKLQDEVEASGVPGETIFVADRGNFDLKLRIEVKEEPRHPLISLICLRKTDHPGETEDCLENAASELRRKLDAADVNETTVYFVVYPSSFEVFRRVRSYVWKKQFGAGWDFRTPQEPFQLGGGGGPEQ